ncbi:MAG: hypothetical protein Q9214_001778, partial [Letrouitia sp. 1 TL-2023]
DELLYAWTEKRLLNILTDLLTQTKLPVAVCLFIDGLDEFDGRYNTVIKTINSLANQPYVKICLSSRPILDFEKAFARKPSLKLQDLTIGSIRAYANAQLFSLIDQQTFYSKGDEKRVKCLVSELARRAEGVFLWAVIAVRNLRDGLEDIVDLSELIKEIESLPAGVENLYTRMLTRIKPAYRRDAARLLQLMLYISNNHNTLDLCRLYFMDKERVDEDQPLIYHEVDVNTLVEGCHNLKTRLLSHTLGLLDLTPPGSSEVRYYGKDYHDQILHTRVDIFHRTVKDYLLHNTAARSLMDAAESREEHLRLSIARGIATHMITVHLLGENGLPLSSRYSPSERLYKAMYQIQHVERLVGVAQTKLMRSLHTYSFKPKGLVISEPPFSQFGGPYKIHRPQELAFDLIGMAAFSGMVRYVCEILDLPVAELRAHPERLSDCQNSYSTEGAYVTRLSWAGPNRGKLDFSHYRQQLSQYLKWEAQVSSTDQTKAPLNCTTLAETYLLNCSSVDTFGNAGSITLITTLLRAGANPMAQFELAGDMAHNVFKNSAWESWLLSLSCFARYCLVGDGFGNSSASLGYRQLLDDVFITTKAFLAQGAQINYQTTWTLVLRHGGYSELELEINYSAMFWLEKCFNRYPEFRDFAESVKDRVKRPLKEITSILHKSKGDRVYPDKKESEMLWQLIEKWEETGYNDDPTIQSAIEKSIGPYNNEHIKASKERNLITNSSHIRLQD